MPEPMNRDALTAAQLDQFVASGFIRLNEVFPRALAGQGRAILWKETGCDPDDPSTWTRPVVRLNQYGHPPFVDAANTPLLHRAFDQLVGAGRWAPPRTLGTFPVRFPSAEDPGDTGWHIDASFGTEDPDFMAWRVNVTSKGRALLPLFLFSDIGDDDAPTRIRVGSHHEIARRLAPAGEEGLTLRELADNGFAETANLREVAATGAAGTVYLCHPFLVHAAQPHRGSRPRFLAQPPLLPTQPMRLDPEDGDPSPVVRAILEAVGRDLGRGTPGSGSRRVHGGAGVLRSGAVPVDRRTATGGRPQARRNRSRSVWDASQP